LECTLSEEGAGPLELDAIPSGAAQVTELWRCCRRASLFRDTQYGQWGLDVLSPRDALGATERERSERPSEYTADDLVVGKFLGDSDLLVVDSTGAVLIATPLEPRARWALAARTFLEFLSAYLDSQGDKYWEP